MAAKIGSLIIDLQSTALTPEEIELLAHPLVGGVILFARNYANRKQLSQLCTSIRATRKTPLLIMVDQEGGRVQRFKNEFSLLPALANFGKIYAIDPARAGDEAKQSARMMASELLSAGLDLSLSPVLDINQDKNTVIGDRSFHSTVEGVTYLAKHYIAGMQEAGMAAVGKHFPGHGSVTEDSHIAIPIDSRSLAEVEASDMQPFKQLIAAKIKAIMTAHIIFPQIDALPVSLSRIWITDILRRKLNFSGTILSDDLSMQGASSIGDATQRFLAARSAGCDFAMICNNPISVMQVLNTIPAEAHLLTADKWQPLQSRIQSTRSIEENITN